MQKTIFHISQMDCPSEEQLIRLKLSEISSVQKLSFDLQARNLTVFSENGVDEILTNLNSLNLGTQLLETQETFDWEDDKSDIIDRGLLWKVLLINFAFFGIEIIAGFVFHSMGLVADSLDMLSDALVYGLSIYAISGSLLIKKRIARLSGLLQILLAMLGFAEVVRRFYGLEDFPNPIAMILVSVFALIANSASLVLLNQSQSNEVHMQSSKIFTSNDVIANLGVIFAGILVYSFQSMIPDLVIGSIVFLLVFTGAIRILKISR